jgi:DtxR family transcriptional regulator, Mn-dependent transcriptional regulator
VNQKAQVAYLHTHERATLEKLMAIGALPGTDLVLLQRFPTFVFQMGKSQFAVDETLASHLYVRRLQQGKK